MKLKLKKRNPNDLTGRNLKAGKKVDTTQDEKIKELEERLRNVETILARFYESFKD